MASSGTKTNYLAHALLDHSMGDGSFTAPTNVYLALDTTVPTVADTGATISEPNGTWTNYARIQLTAANFEAAGGTTVRQKIYNAVVDFGTATCSASTNINGWAIVDNGTIGAGNALWVGQFSPLITVQDGNPVSVPSGQLILEESATFGTPS